jgi:uncharacterized alkaline shock family protein YloU
VNHPRTRTLADVLYGIAQLALDQVDGVRTVTPPTRVGEFLTGRRAKGIVIDREGDDLTIDLNVSVTYGLQVPEVAKAAQRAVREAVASMTGLSVRSVDVHVEAIDLPAEGAGRAWLGGGRARSRSRRCSRPSAAARRCSRPGTSCGSTWRRPRGRRGRPGDEAVGAAAPVATRGRRPRLRRAARRRVGGGKERSTPTSGADPGLDVRPDGADRPQRAAPGARPRCAGETPPAVAVEMAVRLAKRFGGEDSGRFVNGVLAKVLRRSPWPRGVT